MPYQHALNELLRDVNLYEFGVVLNHVDQSSLPELCESLAKELDQPELSQQAQQILPVFAIANIKALIDALENLQALSADQKNALKNALCLAKEDPAAFNACLKVVESLRQEP